MTDILYCGGFNSFLWVHQYSMRRRNKFVPEKAFGYICYYQADRSESGYAAKGVLFGTIRTPEFYFPQSKYGPPELCHPRLSTSFQYYRSCKWPLHWVFSPLNLRWYHVAITTIRDTKPEPILSCCVAGMNTPFVKEISTILTIEDCPLSLNVFMVRQQQRF